MYATVLSKFFCDYIRPANSFLVGGPLWVVFIDELHQCLGCFGPRFVSARSQFSREKEGGSHLQLGIYERV